MQSVWQVAFVEFQERQVQDEATDLARSEHFQTEPHTHKPKFTSQLKRI